MNLKINIISIPVKNLEKSTSFYKEIFNLPENSISSDVDHVAFFLEDELSFVLYERSEFAKMTEQPVDTLNTTSVIFSHFAQNPTEVDSILSRALQAGGTVVKEGTKEEWGYTGLFKDIDGYTWEVMSSL